jgi:hypothetical protein
MYAELDGVMCSGPFRGRHLTYALLAERAPKSRALSRDEALAELTRRYFSSHGPATIRDFVWWSGLTTRDARRGLDMNRTRHEVREGLTYSTVGRAARDGVRDPRVHLLPIYDEYLVAYRDREAVPHGPSTFRTRARQPVTFQHALVVGGQVAGTWRVHNHSDGVKLDVAVLRRLSAAERQGLADAVTRYGRFLSVPSSFTVR